MRKQAKALTVVLVAAAIHLALGVRPARACSPPPPAQLEPCERVEIIAPGHAFPLNLAGEIRVARSSFDGYGYTQSETFELSAPLTIARQSGDGYVAVAFELVSEPNLLPGARSVHLVEPLPGDYIAASVDHTCSDTPSPIGEGALIGSFSLTEAAAVPTVLGTAAWAGQERSTVTYNLGINGACEAQTAQVVVARNTIRVTLADEVLPWSGALETSIEVDGELYAGFAPAANSIEGRELNVTLDHICSTDDPAVLKSNPNRLDEGAHTVKLIGRVGDSAPFASTEAGFEIDCDTDDGCSAAPGRRRAGHGPAWWALGAALLLQRARRATRSR